MANTCRVLKRGLTAEARDLNYDLWDPTIAMPCQTAGKTHNTFKPQVSKDVLYHVVVLLI
jgi:hypothetical protein